MNHSDWSKKDLEYIWHPCSQMKDYETLPPIVVDHGKGVNLYDVDGKRYLDVVSSWWCNLLGHSHPKINRAIKEQLDSLEHVIFANFSHRPAITLCEELMKKIPRGLCKFNFSDNGSASIESAMKMSFQYHYQTGNRQKVRFMSLSDAYHGETLGALSAGGLDLYSELYKPLLLDIVRIPAPDCYRCPKGNKRGCCQAECIDAAQEAFARHGDECAALLTREGLPARLAQELAFLYEGHIGTALQAFRNDTFKAALGLAKELCSYAAQNDTYRTLVLVTKYERDRESFLALLWQLDQLCSAVLRRPAYGAEQCGGLTPDRAARILQVSAATRKTVTGNGNLRLAVAVFAAETAR